MPGIARRTVAAPAQRPVTGLDWIAPNAALACTAPDACAWDGNEIQQRAARLAARLRARLPEHAVVGTLADNSPHWLVADLALHAAGLVHVPLPSFFTSEQTTHAMRASGMSALFCADASLAARFGYTVATTPGEPLACYASPERDLRSAAIRHTAKITFTSGTTGTPKGVMLSTDQQLATAYSLAEATAALKIERHLCLLPLPVLLENVAGAYTALLSGAACICPSLAQVGMHGASGFDAHRCLDLIARTHADSLMVLPQMLHALVAALEAPSSHASALAGLKFVAVGGARTPATLIERARGLGLPVYEGYGLSECASVVSLNLPGADRPGSVGKALPGVAVRIAGDGEIEVRGRRFDGHLGAESPAREDWFPTGDLGTLDACGHLTIVGRKKHVLVTSYGRNVSPEWPEALVADHPGILQAAVFGDARPFLVAIVAAADSCPDAAIEKHIAQVNARLPDYARIGAWIRAHEPFTPSNRLATPNGRIRRTALYERYAKYIGALYDADAIDALPSCPAPTRL